MSVKFRNVLLAAAATMVSLTAGCTDGGTPVSPRSTAAPASPRPTATAVAQLARFRVKPNPITGWAKGWIGPGGGRMDFVGFSVIVPPGAVNKVTMFTIKLPADLQDDDHVVAEFGPHNVAFAKPVTIGFPYRGTTLEGDPNGMVVWWNNGWVDMGGTVSADGSQILTQTPHFSEYGTTSSRGGLTLSGG